MPALPVAESRFFDVAGDARVLAHCNWQPDRKSAPTLLALHGLEASSEAHYMRGLADKAFAAGFNVVRLNQRNCGGTEHLSRGLYHSGLTADPVFVLNELRDRDGLSRFAVSGYSLGGNIAMKLAGELGDRELPEVKAFAAVSPVIELEDCIQSIERRENRIYEWNFCRNLQGRMRRKAKTFPDLFDLNGLWKIWSIRSFDDRYTAPHHGYNGAADYYHRASAMRVIDRVARPSLILSAADDPFVPPHIFDAPAVKNNPHITTVITPHGGHCAFVEPPPTSGEASAKTTADKLNSYDGYFAERIVVDFLKEHI
ncbi:MAG TPA: alpha/beta fold hydrolase [Vicinamibacterales bacterium]|nr:alpha/beta fold hydrolase [Vicinamibacterales bacterium]